MLQCVLESILIKHRSVAIVNICMCAHDVHLKHAALYWRRLRLYKSFAYPGEIRDGYPQPSSGAQYAHPLPENIQYVFVAEVLKDMRCAHLVAFLVGNTKRVNFAAVDLAINRKVAVNTRFASAKVKFKRHLPPRAFAGLSRPVNLPRRSPPEVPVEPNRRY